MKARRKEIVDVVRWYKVGDYPNIIGIPERLKKFIPPINGATGYLYDEYGHDGVFVYSGDYIVKRPGGFVDVIGPDEFEELYEIINEEEV